MQCLLNLVQLAGAGGKGPPDRVEWLVEWLAQNRRSAGDCRARKRLLIAVAGDNRATGTIPQQPAYLEPGNVADMSNQDFWVLFRRGPAQTFEKLASREDHLIHDQKQSM